MPLPPKIPFRDQVYGVLALWIVFFHLSYYIPLEWNIPLVTNFFRLGDAAVDIFLLISGYCITLSLGKDASIRRFYNSRLKRILLSLRWIPLSLRWIPLSLRWIPLSLKRIPL